MYSRQFFIDRFRDSDTEDLLDRLATADLTDEARDAIHSVLRERGISDRDFGSLIQKAKKDQFRRTTPGNKCDYCGQSLRFSRVTDEGQKFCSNSCLRNARLMEVAVDVPEEEILKHALELRDGQCPSCHGRESKIEMRPAYWVWSAMVYTRWGMSSTLCCKKCGTDSNLASIATCFLLGWWGFPFGLLITPLQIGRNISAMLRSAGTSTPSAGLLHVAKLQLAEARLGGRSKG